MIYDRELKTCTSPPRLSLKSKTKYEAPEFCRRFSAAKEEVMLIDKLQSVIMKINKYIDVCISMIRLLTCQFFLKKNMN
jgi:hypothetical protein